MINFSEEEGWSDYLLIISRYLSHFLDSDNRLLTVISSIPCFAATIFLANKEGGLILANAGSTPGNNSRKVNRLTAGFRNGFFFVKIRAFSYVSLYSTNNCFPSEPLIIDVLGL